MTGDPGQVLTLHLMTPTQGWLLTDRHLLWTADAGASWNEIGPDVPAGTSLSDAFFLDADSPSPMRGGSGRGFANGWLAAATPADRRASTLTVFRTVDGARSWRASHLPALPTFGPTTLSYAAFGLEFVDLRHGWIRLWVPNIEIDPPLIPTLKTDDGGASWTWFAPPHPGWFRFRSPLDGWTPAPNTGLQVTHDGGKTWQSQALPVPVAYRNRYLTIDRPTFLDPKNAVLPVTYYTDTFSAIVFYRSMDGGNSWHALPPVADPLPHPFGQDQGITSLVRPGVWAILFRPDLAVSPDQGSTWTAVSPQGVESLSAIDYVTPDFAWGLGTYRVCPAGAACTYTWGPVETQDGGRHWGPIRLP